MTDILAEIIARKRLDLAAQRQKTTLTSLERRAATTPPPRGFHRDLATAAAAGGFGLIAEIKKASPSHGLIRPEFDPANIATTYAEAGATCLSVLTDTPYFQGGTADLAAARAAIDLPILRKDFTIDPYQVIEARAIGADAILLIMAALSDRQAAELEAVAMDYKLDVLIEVHDEAELDRALGLKSPLIGINNRNLKTLKTDLGTSLALSHRLPEDRLAVSESGLQSHADLQRMAEAGIRCFLVGESLLRQGDIGLATRLLLGSAA